MHVQEEKLRFKHKKWTFKTNIQLPQNIYQYENNQWDLSCNDRTQTMKLFSYLN